MCSMPVHRMNRSSGKNKPTTKTAPLGSHSVTCGAKRIALALRRRRDAQELGHGVLGIRIGQTASTRRQEDPIALLVSATESDGPGANLWPVGRALPSAAFHCRKSAPPSPRFKAGEGIFAFVEDDANGSLETAHGHGGGPEVLCRLHTWCHGTSLGECDQTVTQYTRHFSILPCSPGQPRPLGKRSPPGSGVADLYGIVSRLGLRVLSVWHVATMPAGSTPRTCSRPSSSSRRWGRALLTSLACDDIVPTQ